jgi:hypothetical protein
VHYLLHYCNCTHTYTCTQDATSWGEVQVWAGFLANPGMTHKVYMRTHTNIVTDLVENFHYFDLACNQRIALKASDFPPLPEVPLEAYKTMAALFAAIERRASGNNFVERVSDKSRQIISDEFARAKWPNKPPEVVQW